MYKLLFRRLLLLSLWVTTLSGYSQVLSLKDALKAATDNYGTIKAKEKYSQAARATVKERKREYLPDLRLSVQQNYGTINGQHGPLHSLGGLGVASTALPRAEQDWTAAFGSLYLANFNWEFFSFGRIKSKIKMAEADAAKSILNLEQEKFQHQVKVAAAYLN
jgi:outer membrane protein TolC